VAVVYNGRCTVSIRKNSNRCIIQVWGLGVHCGLCFADRVYGVAWVWDRVVVLGGQR
jgi:hypothetical protein